MKRLFGYLLGIALTLLGILFIVFVFTDNDSHSAFVGYVVAGVFLLTGISMIIAVSLRYGGGLWTITGYLLTAFGVLVVIDALYDFLRKNQKPDSSELLICFVLLALGIACLGQGHRIHKWKKANHSDDPLDLSGAHESKPRSPFRSAPWAPAWVGLVFGVWFVWHYFDTAFKFQTFAKAWQKEGLPLTLNELNQWYKPVAP